MSAASPPQELVQALQKHAQPAPEHLQPLLELTQLEVVYGRAITAVQGVSLQVNPGQIVALLGSNGAGKSTIMRAVSGFLGIDNARVSDGSIRFNRQLLNDMAPHRISALGVTLVPERSKVFENLTVAENLEASVAPSRARRELLTQTVYQQFPRLAQLRSRQAGYLSGGERQMLAIGAALICDPKLLLIDELSQGLAPVVVLDLLERLRTLRQQLGLSLLIVEQNTQIALEFADFGYILENGRIVLSGSASRLIEHADVQEFYLGGTSRSENAGASSSRSYRDVKQYRRSRRWFG